MPRRKVKIKLATATGGVPATQKKFSKPIAATAETYREIPRTPSPTGKKDGVQNLDPIGLGGRNGRLLGVGQDLGGLGQVAGGGGNHDRQLMRGRVVAAVERFVDVRHQLLDPDDVF